MVTKTDHGFIRPTGLEEEMRSSYMDYAMSVIVSRALPDVRDGLKPVQRRILYAMHDLGMRPNSAYKKSARLVGEVLGKWHPHGDAPVYDAMVRMAQDFSLRMPLIDGQGNFGSIDNDPPAAMRYTEARLSTVAEAMLQNLDQDTVDFVDNFDGTLQEPTVLPARLPNLLINGASGIAVGMATSIPPHNPSEICNAIIRMIDDPDITVEALTRSVRAPDFPTGATIMGLEGVKSAYATGRGQIVVRAKADFEAIKSSNRMQIVVTELPYQVNKGALIEKIASLVKNRQVDGITELRDESDRHGMRIVMELRSGAQAPVILNNLYKFTAMQSTFSANMLALVDGAPRVITLKQALQQYIKFRQEVVTRRSRFELKKAQERAHILAGLRIALQHLDEIIALIRNARDVEAARVGLMSRFDLDQPQAQAILDMQLRRIAALEREKIENEYQDLQSTIRELEELLADEIKVLAVIKSETQLLKKKVVQKRRTAIAGEAEELEDSDLVAREQMVITLSRDGYVKRIPASTYRSQHRGGKGVVGMSRREEDPVAHILVCGTHDSLLFFTDKGRVLPLFRTFVLRGDTSRTTRGVPVINVIPLGEREKVNAILSVESLEQRDKFLQMAQDLFLLMTTRKGAIKRVALSALATIRRSGLIIMRLKGGDELVTALLTRDEDEVIMVSRQGMSVRFPVAQVTARQRAAGGVRGMTLRSKDTIVGMDIAAPDSKLLVISKNGFGKLTDLKKYRSQSRGGIGIKTFNITKKTGPVAAADVIDDSKEVYVVSAKAQVLRTSLSEIRSYGRATQGVTIFKPERGDSVVSIACVSDLNVPEEAEVPVDSKASAKRNGKRNAKVPQGRLKI